MKNSNGRQQARRMVSRALGSALFVLFLWGMVRVYRWAEPDPNALRAVSGDIPPTDLALRLERSEYTDYFGGVKSWSLRADRIELMRAAGSLGLSGLQRADVTNIRNGILYDAPPKPAPGGPRTVSAVRMEEASSETDSATPSASFSARQGHYTIGMPLSAPPDLQINYHVLWQFQLAGDVQFRTRQGDRLSTPSLTILQLVNFRTGKQERRILCDEGVQVTVKKIKIQANSVRYDPVLRRIECLGGVRGVLPGPHSQDTIQAERLYWALDGQTIRCPETASGVLNGMPFTTEGMNIDLRRHIFDGARLDMKMSSAGVSPLSPP